MDYLRPATLTEAYPALQAGARVLAGGTDLYPGAGPRLGPVVDLSALADMRGITGGITGGISGGISGRDGLRIGALTTWTEIAQARLPPACTALQEAARQVGGRQIQNTATLGGNLCNASPAADGVPPLLVLGAEVDLAGPMGARRLPLADFVTGPRQTALRPGEVLVAVRLPKAALNGQSRFEKLGARAYLVISIAMVAVRLVTTGDRITAAAVAVGACSGAARRLPGVEAALAGPRAGAAARVRAGDVAAALSPIDDVRATGAYRASAAATLIARAVERLA